MSEPLTPPRQQQQMKVSVSPENFVACCHLCAYAAGPVTNGGGAVTCFICEGIGQGDLLYCTHHSHQLKGETRWVSPSWQDDDPEQIAPLNEDKRVTASNNRPMFFCADHYELMAGNQCAANAVNGCESRCDDYTHMFHWLNTGRKDRNGWVSKCCSGKCLLECTPS